MVRLPNMTRMIDSLIKDEIAVREKSVEDRRKVMVKLTAKGTEIRTQFMANRRESALSIFSMLSEKDKKELMECLEKACTILQRTVEK
jgi:DNA-binding MarR family transcriptional regulator